MNGKSDKSVYFPFGISKTDLEDAIKAKNFHRCGDEAVELLRQFAPYRGGNDRLRAIHDLDIQDKHRSLVISMTGLGLRIKRMFRGGRLIHAELSDYTLDYVFPNEGPFAQQSIFEVLENLVKLVEDILETFELR